MLNMISSPATQYAMEIVQTCTIYAWLPGNLIPSPQKYSARISEDYGQ